VRGKIHSADGVKIIAMYHPAGALYTARLKAVFDEDFRKLAGLQGKL